MTAIHDIDAEMEMSEVPSCVDTETPADRLPEFLGIGQPMSHHEWQRSRKSSPNPLNSQIANHDETP